MKKIYLSRILVLAAMVFTIALDACSGSPGTSGLVGERATITSGGSQDPSVLQYISTALSPAEQEIMYPVVSMLKPAERENVYFTDLHGVVHVNRPELLDQQLQTQTQGQPVVRAVETFAPCIATSSDGECTGVFYKHQPESSVVNAGSAFFEAAISIPCASTVLIESTTEPTVQANIYATLTGAQVALPGSGSTAGSPPPDSLEFGLQFNNNGASPVTSVQPYITENGVYVDLTSSPHLLCDQRPDVGFTARILQPNGVSDYAVLDLAGAFTSQSPSPCGSQQYCIAEVTTVKALQVTDGITQVCPGCTFSWTTGLAVKANAIPQYAIGSTFGVDSNCSPQIRWSSVRTGHYSNIGPNAQPSTVPWSSSNVVAQPTNGVSLGFLHIVDADDADEQIGIDESFQACPINATIY